MIMKKILSLLCACTLMGLASCSNDEHDDPTPTPVTPSSFYVINQGNIYAGISGSLSFGDGKAFTSEITTNMVLGDTPQNGVILGKNLYIPCYGSSDLAVIDTESHSVVQRIRLNQPQHICTDGHYLYVTESNGHLARLSPLSSQIDRVHVGDSPYACVYSHGKVYINCGPWTADWSEPIGTSVKVVNTQSFTCEPEIAVGLNPYDQMAVDANGYIYTVCCGNYNDIMSEVWQISPDGTARAVCPGDIITTRDNLIYVYDSFWATLNLYTSDAKAPIKNVSLGRENLILNPVSMTVDPATGELYITSDLESYDLPGALYVFDPYGNALLSAYATGVHPYRVVFKP